MSLLDRVKGGRADGNKPADFDSKQLAMGIEVEKEHTKDEKLAREIAMDHLKEIPDYYTRLKRMEKEAGVGESTDFPSRYSSPAAGSSRTGVGTAPMEDPRAALIPPKKRRPLKTKRP